VSIYNPFTDPSVLILIAAMSIGMPVLHYGERLIYTVRVYRRYYRRRRS
jgi:hypothetical protein